MVTLLHNKRGAVLISLHLILLSLVMTLFHSCNQPSGSKIVIEIDSLDTGTKASLRALHVVDNNTVWAAGSKGTFLLTTNGGKTWKTGTVPGVGNDEFRSIYAWDAERALVFGVLSPGRGYKTTTAGENWQKVYENMSRRIFFNSVSFADDDKGIALSDAIDSISFLIRTNDGGQTWEQIVNLPPLKEGEAHFAASNSCIDYHPSGMIWYVTGGNEARVFRSTDDGATWNSVNSGLVHGDNASGCFAVKFMDDNKGIIVGGTYDQPEQNERIAAWTKDSGATWNLAETMPAQYCSSVTWLGVNGEVALAAGKTGIDYSVDGGRNWSHLSDEGFYTIQAVPGTYEGYAAGKEGLISHFKIKYNNSKNQ